jgi:hypothetical protein
VSFIAPAQADKIGVNFVGGSQPSGTPAPVKPDEIAGPFAQKFWNNAYEKSGTLSPVGDNEKGSSASYVGFSVNWTAFQTNTNPIAPWLGSGYGIEGPPDYRLTLGFLDATANQPATNIEEHPHPIQRPWPFLFARRLFRSQQHRLPESDKQ